LAVAAAIASLQVIEKEGLVARSEQLGHILLDGLRPIQARHPQRLGCLWGKGLVAGLQVVQPGTKTPDADTATKINVACFQKGLLMFAPVGVAGECLKISPPLVITEDALRESIAVFAAACDEVL
jgi:4-aminobutyrate aminotransferase-like enzyme